MAKQDDHHRFDGIIRLVSKNAPLILLLVWAVLRPDQSGDVLKVFGGIVIGKSFLK
jgi:hypothetical protein